MSYAKSTISSRRRSRTPVLDPAAKDDSAAALLSDGTPRQSTRSDTPPHSRVRSRVDSGAHSEAKRARKDPWSLHRHHKEEIELSQELTSQCDAVALRVSALLDKAQLQEKRLQKVLKENLERSPLRHQSTSPLRAAIDTLSPQPTQMSETPKRNSTRRSGTDRTPQAPTLAPADATAAAAPSVGWIGKLFGRSPEVQLTPASKSATPPRSQSEPPRAVANARESPAKNASPPPAAPAEPASLLQRAFQRLSGRFSSPPPPTESPQRSRKSVGFKEPDDLKTATPPKKEKGKASEPREDGEPTPRGSLLYPPAPPPSAQKENSQRLSSGRVPNDKEAGDKAQGSGKSDVETIIRTFSQARALRELTKADLVDYAKSHHVSLSMSSSKKELFDAVRPLAKGSAKATD